MKKKYCKKCSKYLPSKAYNKKSCRKDGLQPHCKKCQSVYSKASYEKNSIDRVATNTSNKKRRAMFHYKRIINRYFAYGCTNCGNKNFKVLEFDHVRGKKKSARGTEGVMSFVREGYSWKKIKKEIDKCVVLCRNCHKLKTYNEYNYWKGLNFDCER